MSEQLQESEGVRALRAMLQTEFAKFLAQPGIRELAQNFLAGIERLEEQQQALGLRLAQAERALTLNLEQLVELRQQLKPADPDEWWRGGDSSE